MPQSYEENLESLITGLGAESHLANKVKALRDERGWSQQALAEQMSRVGTPLHQSAISKIETPSRDGRRAITVSEALGFARAFGVPLRDLLLPAEGRESLELLKNLAAGPEQRRVREAADHVYAGTVAATAALMSNRQEFASIVANEVGAAEDRVVSKRATEDDHNRFAFLRDVLAEYTMLQVRA